MRPILFTLWGWDFPSWHVFFALAVTAAMVSVRHIMRHWNQTDAQQRLSGFFLCVYPAGWFGARGLSLLVEDFQGQGFHWAGLFQIGSMTFYGGALAGAAVGLLLLRKWHCDLLTWAMACLPAVVLGLAIGRLGCHFNGDDWGIPVEGHPWWAVDRGEGVPALWPVQLEEAAFSLALWALLFWALCRQAVPPRGTQAARVVALLALSPLHRFFNEFYRGDPRGAFPGTASLLSTSQGIALLLTALLGGWAWRLSQTPHVNEGQT